LQRNLREIDNGNSIYKAITINDNKQMESPLVYLIYIRTGTSFYLTPRKEKKIMILVMA